MLQNNFLKTVDQFSVCAQKKKVDHISMCKDNFSFNDINLTTIDIYTTITSYYIARIVLWMITPWRHLPHLRKHNKMFI